MSCNTRVEDETSKSLPSGTWHVAVT